MLKRNFLRVLDYFFLMRPMLFFQGWTLLLTGTYLAQPSLQPATFILSGKLSWLMLAIALEMGAVFIQNQIQDVESDTKNGKGIFLPRQIISPKKAYGLSFLLFSSSLLIAFSLHFRLGLLFVGCWILSYLYNYQPFSGKGRPWLGTLINALGSLFLILMGWFIFNQFTAIPWTRILPYFFLSIGFFFFTTIPDRSGDSLSGKITVAVRYGVRRTNRLAFLFFLSGFLVSLFHLDLLVLLISGFGGFISIYFGMKPDESIISRGLKYLLAVYAFIIAWYFPWYLIAMVVLFTSTKFYYRYRFAIDYPNFKAV